MSKKYAQREPPDRIEWPHKPMHIFCLLHKFQSQYNYEMAVSLYTKHCINTEYKVNLPIVVAVIDARRPTMQENGSDMANAPDPIFEICITC